jgi:hypothetical protein
MGQVSGKKICWIAKCIVWFIYKSIVLFHHNQIRKAILLFGFIVIKLARPLTPLLDYPVCPSECCSRLGV